jgi:4-hydroxybenzoate polyprenyltransferase
MIILPFSLMVQVLYELRDFEVDRETKVTNTIQRLGRFDTKRLLIACGATAVIGFTIIFIFLAIPAEFKIVIFFSSLFLAIVLASRVNRFLKTYFAKTSSEV